MVSKSLDTLYNRSLQPCLACPGHQSQYVAQSFLSNQNPQNIDKTNELKQTEEFLAAEFNKLSIQEQYRAIGDLYGAGQELNEENPDLIETSLQNLERKLQQSGFKFYKMAADQNPLYVQDISFRLKFLRSNMYNVDDAVRQMEKFLMQKATYFGMSKIAHDITLHDLNEEDMKCMLSGLLHIQDGVDRHGRPIFYASSMTSTRWKLDTVIRVFYYVSFNILGSMPVVQQKGIVGVYYDTSKPGRNFIIPDGLDGIRKFSAFVRSIPVRSSATHICLKKESASISIQNLFVNLMANALPQHTRVRARIHYKSDIEIQYELKMYSIPSGTFPIDVNGNIRKDIMNVWFHLHMASDASCTSTFNCIVVQEESDAMIASQSMGEEKGDDSEFTREDLEMAKESTDREIANVRESNREERPKEDENQNKLLPKPTQPVLIQPTDVLLGKGHSVQRHRGNIRFREFLMQHRNEYHEGTRNSKRQLVIGWIKDLKSEGVRFLELTPESGEWVESGSKTVETKAMQFLRWRRLAA